MLVPHRDKCVPQWDSKVPEWDTYNNYILKNNKV